MKRTDSLPTNRQIEQRFSIIRVLVAVGISLVCCLALIFIVSGEPLTAFSAFLLGPLSSFKDISNIFQTAAPLIFTGLAVSVMFSANQFNLAAEGSFFLGGLAGSAVAVRLVLPHVVHPIVAILAGGVAGAILCGIPAVLKVKLGASEIVSSLMLNFIALFFGVFILNRYLLDMNAGFPATEALPDTARMSSMIPKANFHAGILFAFALAVLVYFFLRRSKYGYAIRMVGQNERFARYSGISVGAAIILAQLVGGLIAGMGGASEVLGVYNRFQWVALPGYGFDGVIVAILANNNPLLVPVGAVFLAYLRTGADIMSRRSDVATEVLAIVQGAIILLVASKLFLKHAKHKYIVANAKKREALEGGEQHG